jgi:hypothetical protein
MTTVEALSVVLGRDVKWQVITTAGDMAMVEAQSVVFGRDGWRKEMAGWSVCLARGDAWPEKMVSGRRLFRNRRLPRER